MNRKLNTLVAGLALSFITLAAHAESPTAAPEVDGFVPQLTRVEVRADLAQAERLGLVARNDAQIHEQAAVNTASLKTRAQVVAETREAARLGLIGAGEMSAPEATPEQRRLIAEAGSRAAAQQVAAR
jgi:hypothetical protein